MTKLVFLVYNISIEEDIQRLLEQQGVQCFTQWPRVYGKGATTGPRMDSSVWPGANSALMAVVEATRVQPLMAAIEQLREGTAKREGCKAFVLPVESMTGEI